jgi:serine/threonine protein kinase
VSAGRIIASKYRLLYELGRGGMGAVWLAEHLALRVHVAVKLIDPGLATSQDYIRRFEREARAAASLRSPHVVQVMDFGVDEGTPYLVMEYLVGESLATRLSQRGSLPVEDVWVVINQIGRAITRAHGSGYIHRDLKPDNVFLMDDEPGFFVKVLDFGLAKALDGAESPSTRSLTRTGTILGTPRHMSPEQAVGGVVDSRSDLWSMAVIAFECLTGRLPFDGKTIPALLRSICFDPIAVPSRVAPRVPLGFDAWFARAVVRDPDKRFQTAKEMVDALEPILQPPALAPPAKAKPRPVIRRSGSDDEPTLKILTGANRPSDRRGELRMSSSIPAAINGQRDLRNTGLIRNASRNGALLATRHRCYPDQILSLTLYVQGPQQGVVVNARVLRVSVRNSDSMWRFDVALQFDTPLDEKVVFELARRASEAST